MEYKQGDRVMVWEEVWEVEDYKGRLCLSNDLGFMGMNSVSSGEIRRATKKEVEDWEEEMERSTRIREGADLLLEEVEYSKEELACLLEEDRISLSFHNEWITRLEKEEDDLYNL